MRATDSAMAEQEHLDPDDFSVGEVARLTGLSPDLLRAWERRHGVVTPRRTPGGTRRYRRADVERLRRLKRLVDAGHRIGDLAGLTDAELDRLLTPDRPSEAPPLGRILRALERLDAAAAEHLLTTQLLALGPGRFARALALPLLRELGDRWQQARLCVASEHLGSVLIRSLLGALLRPSPARADAPRIVFATLPEERHELGLLAAAVVALAAGADVLYLGSDLPVEEIAGAARTRAADAVALSLVRRGRSGVPAGGQIAKLREALPRSTAVLVGGPGAKAERLPAGVAFLPDLDALEERVRLLAVTRARS